MHTEEDVKIATFDYFGGDRLATNVWMTKYALKNKKGQFVESTPRDMHERLANEFARIESKYPNPLSRKKILEYLDNFKYIVPQGSPMMGVGNDYVKVSLSNCVVVDSPADNISSIMDAGKDLANLFKRRCGVGLDISELRPEDAPVNNAAGTTTGAWSFADFYSYVCRMIGQNGRRGALMISMDVRHPDIEQFVEMKHDLSKVTGANVSVKISDCFMEAVESKQSFTLQFPVGSENPTHTKTIEATDLWNKIVESATKTAEPGLLMWDNIIKNLPADCYKEEGFRTLTTNPCGEIPLSAYDSCRLISVNLKHLVERPFTDEAYFDLDRLAEITKSAMRLSDDLIELEIEKLKNILSICDTPDEKELWTKLLKACEDGRRTGLGTHGLADAIARLNTRYDSSEAIKIIEAVYEVLRDSAYEESVNLAKERGTFPIFDWDKEKDNEFIKRLPKSLIENIKKYGRRNISILTNAPTGSVSIMSQTSSGLEPVFRNFYIRRRKLSHNEQHVEADYTDDLGDKWVEYKVFHHNAKEWLDVHDDEELPDFFVQSDGIDWKKRVEIQAIIQKSIDHSISSTINLPEGTSVETVAELYQLGWKSGLKGVTVYVDNCRSGVLVTKSRQLNELFPQYDAPKRKKDLTCNIHRTKIKGEDWVILVGLLDDKPYEVMGGLADLIEIPRKYKEGTLIKNSYKTIDSRYDLKFGENGDEVAIKDIVKVFDNANHSAFTRMISLALRHGARPSFLVEQLQKDRDSDMFSFSRCVARVLKNYIMNGEVPSDKTCTECKQDSLAYQDGCAACTSCGYTACS
jgi:ribonucleoside-diphosphate reductase alpha chain